MRLLLEAIQGVSIYAPLRLISFIYFVYIH
jgi:hypothetical protein